MNIWTSFRDAFLSEGNYENLSSDSMLSLLPWLIIAIFVGIALSFVVTVFTKRVLGAMVRGMLSDEASSPEKAKTLSELGFDKNFFLRRAVRGNVSLRRVVHCREEEEFLLAQEEERAAYEEARKNDPSMKKWPKKVKEFRVDSMAHHFYIPEECRDMASVKFNQKGTSIGSLVVLFVLLLIFLIVLLIALPWIMEMVDSIVGTLKSAASSGNDKIV
ncbi:MAG: hypothetical protein J6Q82_01430 [Clostridia bacterium]|nr:hypothetical protein [Clostridia bacterium]